MVKKIRMISVVAFTLKILFFEVNSTLPLLQVPSNSQVIPLQIPCKSHFSPILWNGFGTVLKRT